MNKLLLVLYQYKYLTAFLATICLYLQQKLNNYQQNYYLYFIFFSTLFIYSLDNYTDQNKKNRLILLPQIISSFIFIITITIFYPIAIYKFFIVFLLCLSYIFPIINNRPLTAYINLKTFFVPSIWIIVLNIPNPQFNLENILYNISLFILLFVNMLACDIIDKQEDKEKNIKSFTQSSINIQKYTKKILILSSIGIFITNIIEIHNIPIIIISTTTYYIFYLIRKNILCKKKIEYITINPIIIAIIFT